MNKFEQLIEYVINDEDAKARELFHDIVVEKSRQIYEELMAQEEEDLEEGDMGGDASDELISDVESEEQNNMSMEGEDDMDMMAGDEEDAADAGDSEEGFSMGDEGGTEPASKDDIMNLEDKLDQLMAEFEGLIGLIVRQNYQT